MHEQSVPPWGVGGPIGVLFCYFKNYFIVEADHSSSFVEVIKNAKSTRMTFTCTITGSL